jgi:hypothetical protein
MALAQARRKVPVVAVALGAHRLVFGRIGLLMEIAWLPLLLLLAAAIAPRLLPGARDFAADEIGLTTPDLIETLAATFCLTAFAVKWQQSVLYPRQSAMPPGLFGRAWARFLAYTTLLYLASFALVATEIAASVSLAQPLVSVAHVAAACLGILLWLATARAALVFPAAAYGVPMGIGRAWQAMRGNSWRLLLCGFIACAPLVLVVAVMASGVLMASVPAESEARLGLVLLRGLLVTLTNFFLVALGGAVLAAFYRQLVLESP